MNNAAETPKGPASSELTPRTERTTERPMSSTLSQKLRPLVDRLVQDISEQVRSQFVEALRASLSPVSAPKPQAKPAKSTRPGRQRRSTAELAAAQRRILEHVRRHPGSRSEEIRSALRLTKQEWLSPIQALLASGQVRSSGQRRLTTYSPR